MNFPVEFSDVHYVRHRWSFVPRFPLQNSYSIHDINIITSFARSWKAGGSSFAANYGGSSWRRGLHFIWIQNSMDGSHGGDRYPSVHSKHLFAQCTVSRRTCSPTSDPAKLTNYSTTFFYRSSLRLAAAAGLAACRSSHVLFCVDSLTCGLRSSKFISLDSHRCSKPGHHLN